MKRGVKQKEAPAYDLKATRERLSKTQAEMSQLLDSAQSSIARWEAEGTLPLIYRKYLALYEAHEYGKEKPVKERNRRNRGVSTKAKSGKEVAGRHLWPR